MNNKEYLKEQCHSIATGLLSPSIPGFLFLLILLFQSASPARAQGFSFKDDLNLGGYIKELGSLSASNPLDEFRYDNVLHHRLESSWDISESLNIRMDIRTRLLNGYSVRHTPNLGNYYDNDPGYMDLSEVFIDTDETLWHATIDRLQATWYHEDLEITAGRQRLNWGRTFVWNPNDLFNNFAYLNFDYEERPGTDALRATYNWSYASGIEVAYSPQKEWDQSVLAAKLRSTIASYDAQFLLGHFKEDIALGTGWSGYLGDAGIKGELTYFHPEEEFWEETGVVTATLGVDYMFANSLYLRSELLYNGGWREAFNPAATLRRPPSAKDLFIAKTGAFASASYPVHPLVNVSLSAITSFSRPIFIAIPEATVSLAENWDATVLAQVLQGEVLTGATDTPNILYARLTYSF